MTAVELLVNESSRWIVTDASTASLSEVRVPSTQYGFLSTVAIGIAAGVTSLVTITGNLVVILSFVLERNIRQPSNYFIASLAVSDLLIGTVSMPFYTAYLLAGHYWLLGEVLCDLWLSVDYSACLCSIYTVFCITVDRYCSVKIPAKYRAWRTNRKILLVIAIIWTIPVLVFFTSIFGWQHFVGERTLKKGECTVQYLQNVVFSTLLQIGYFWVTLVIMCSLYAGIYMAALRLQKKSEEKRKKIAQLLANTPTTRSQKVFLERSDLGPNSAKEETSKAASGRIETDRVPPAAKHPNASNFRISSSSMALSSESEKSPTTLLEESRFNDANNISNSSNSNSSRSGSRKHDDNGDDDDDRSRSDDVISGPDVFDGTFPADDSGKHKHPTQSPNRQAASLAKSITTTTAATTTTNNNVTTTTTTTFTTDPKAPDQDEGSFSKSQTTETTLSTLCYEDHKTKSKSDQDRGRFQAKRLSRNLLQNVRSRRKNVSIRTDEEGSDCSATNSRNSSFARKDPSRSTSGEMFTISGRSEIEKHVATERKRKEKEGEEEKEEKEKKEEEGEGVVLEKNARAETNGEFHSSTGLESSLGRVRRFLLSNRSRISGLTAAANECDPKRLKNQPSRREDRALKALRTITIILGAFLLCWTPWHVLTLIMGFCSTCVDSHLYDVSYWFCYINSPMNPFCYAFANKQFKKTFLRIFRLDWQRT